MERLETSAVLRHRQARRHYTSQDMINVWMMFLKRFKAGLFSQYLGKRKHFF